MYTKNFSRTTIILIALISVVSCKKDKIDDNPSQNMNNVARTATFNASITGDYTDSISISFNPGIGGIEGVTTTFDKTAGELSMLTLKPLVNGSKSIDIFCELNSLSTGTYGLGVFAFNTSSYFNSVIGAQNFEVDLGSFTITKVETIATGNVFAGQKYFSGNFSMQMENPTGELINVTGTFENALVITIN